MVQQKKPQEAKEAKEVLVIPIAIIDAVGHNRHILSKRYIEGIYDGDAMQPPRLIEKQVEYGRKYRLQIYAHHYLESGAGIKGLKTGYLGKPRVKGALILYDPTEEFLPKDTIRACVADVRYLLPDAPIVLVRHIDKQPESVMSAEERRGLAARLEIPSMRVNSRNNENVEEVFAQLVEETFLEQLRSIKLTLDRLEYITQTAQSKKSSPITLKTELQTGLDIQDILKTLQALFGCSLPSVKREVMALEKKLAYLAKENLLPDQAIIASCDFCFLDERITLLEQALQTAKTSEKHREILGELEHLTSLITHLYQNAVANRGESLFRLNKQLQPYTQRLKALNARAKSSLSTAQKHVPAESKDAVAARDHALEMKRSEMVDPKGPSLAGSVPNVPVPKDKDKKPFAPSQPDKHASEQKQSPSFGEHEITVLNEQIDDLRKTLFERKVDRSKKINAWNSLESLRKIVFEQYIDLGRAAITSGILSSVDGLIRDIDHLLHLAASSSSIRKLRENSSDPHALPVIPPASIANSSSSASKDAASNWDDLDDAKDFEIPSMAQLPAPIGHQPPGGLRIDMPATIPQVPGHVASSSSSSSSQDADDSSVQVRGEEKREADSGPNNQRVSAQYYKDLAKQIKVLENRVSYASTKKALAKALELLEHKRRDLIDQLKHEKEPETHKQIETQLAEIVRIIRSVPDRKPSFFFHPSGTKPEIPATAAPLLPGQQAPDGPVELTAASSRFSYPGSQPSNPLPRAPAVGDQPSGPSGGPSADSLAYFQNLTQRQN